MDPATSTQVSVGRSMPKNLVDSQFFQIDVDRPVVLTVYDRRCRRRRRRIQSTVIRLATGFAPCSIMQSQSAVEELNAFERYIEPWLPRFINENPNLQYARLNPRYTFWKDDRS